MSDYKGVLPLYAPEGYQLHQDDDGRGYYQAEQEPSGLPGGATTGALPGKPPAQKPPSYVQATSGMGGSQRPAPGEVAHRALNPEELMALAQQMQDDISNQSAGLDSQPSSVESTIQRDSGAPYWLRSYMGDK